LGFVLGLPFLALGVIGLIGLPYALITSDWSVLPKVLGFIPLGLLGGAAVYAAITGRSPERVKDAFW
jgi:hypothetical protein